MANKRSVYVVTERDVSGVKKSFWTKVGVAFDNRDGSVTIKLEALPLSGTLQIRDDDARKDAPPPLAQDEIPF